jgi:hypothetical protein
MATLPEKIRQVNSPLGIKKLVLLALLMYHPYAGLYLLII